MIFRNNKKHKLSHYLNFFRGTLLSEYEYKELMERYNNFSFGNWEPFPQKEDYPNLYKNEEFSNYVKNCKRYNLIMAYTLPFTLLLTFILGMVYG